MHVTCTTFPVGISHIREQHTRYRVNLSVKQAKENEEHSLQGEMAEEDVMEVVDEEEELASGLEEEWEVEWLPSLSRTFVPVVCSLA